MSCNRLICLAVRVDWNTEELARAIGEHRDGTNEVEESSIRRRFPAYRIDPGLRRASKPCIVVDQGGVILAWCLPDVFSHDRQASDEHCREPHLT